uniref:p14 n=1 Tax=Little cherry virus 2 TaxID=154339 RepID=A0A679G5J1_9CLOS|nr:p14 [Little cherry virus 2]
MVFRACSTKIFPFSLSCSFFYQLIQFIKLFITIFYLGLRLASFLSRGGLQGPYEKRIRTPNSEVSSEFSLDLTRDKRFRELSRLPGVVPTMYCHGCKRAPLVARTRQRYEARVRVLLVAWS